VTATGSDLAGARDAAYEGVRAIQFRGMQIRRDIAARALGSPMPRS
jgi:phosphoribosylamine-glycine ligase